MEVTTVSPSPASLTEGDDLCDTDVTSVAMHSVTLLICLCGLAGNGAGLLGSCLSSSNRTTHFILILTFFDLLFLLFLFPSTLLFLVEDVSCSIIMPLQFVWFLFQVSLVSHSVWLYTLTCISIMRCRSIHCPLWQCCQGPQRLAWVVCALLWAFTIALITVITTTNSLCVFKIPEHCRVTLISMHAFNLLLCIPFTLISSTVPLIKAKYNSHQQQLKRKRLDIVICLIVLFTLPLSLWNLLQQLGYTIVPSQMAFLLACMHSSIKPFIYFLSGRGWRPCSMGSVRLSLQRVFAEPEENTACGGDPVGNTRV